MTQALKGLYQELFFIALAFATPKFFSVAEDPTPFLIEATIVETCLFLSPVMFKISLELLIFHLVVAILYYLYRPRKFLPRMSTSIAFIISYVHASRLFEDFGRSGTEKRMQGIHLDDILGPMGRLMLALRGNDIWCRWKVRIRL